MDKKWTEPRRKIIGVPLQKQLTKNDDGTLLVRGYFTSDNRDEVGDIITRAATERAVPRYRQWGNIRLMHLPRPVAKMVRIGIEDGLEWNEIEIKVIDPEAVFMVEQGLLPALSVGILVNFDDIDFLEDGGWIINEYALAEISLVDHPANYDARLKEIPANQDLRMLAREYGLDVVARSVEALKAEDTMQEEIKELESELPVEELPAVEEQVVSEEPEVIQEEITQEVEIVEEEISVEEEIVEEEAPVEEVIEEVVETVPAEEEAVSDPLEEMKSLVAALKADLQALSLALAETRRAYEATAEASQAEMQAESEKAVAVEAEAEEDGGLPVGRKGATPETVLPDTKALEAQKGQPMPSLRDALRKRFEN
jgi:hypothetical protein